jgi:NAD(P)-dependent dehydrogenase (short-subunit alcohol dehydrogenase family)
MSDILKGKVVIVTGAASGIGRAIAIAAAQHWAKAVIVSGLTERSLIRPERAASC